MYQSETKTQMREEWESSDIFSFYGVCNAQIINNIAWKSERISDRQWSPDCSMSLSGRVFLRRHLSSRRLRGSQSFRSAVALSVWADHWPGVGGFPGSWAGQLNGLANPGSQICRGARLRCGDEDRRPRGRSNTTRHGCACTARARAGLVRATEGS